VLVRPQRDGSAREIEIKDASPESRVWQLERAAANVLALPEGPIRSNRCSLLAIEIRGEIQAVDDPLLADRLSEIVHALLGADGFAEDDELSF
jgi:hypothetical protein